MICIARGVARNTQGRGTYHEGNRANISTSDNEPLFHLVLSLGLTPYSYPSEAPQNQVTEIACACQRTRHQPAQPTSYRHGGRIGCGVVDRIGGPDLAGLHELGTLLPPYRELPMIGTDISPQGPPSVPRQRRRLN